MVLKGLNKGSRPTDVEEGQWVDGWNFVITDDGKSIKNEDGTSISSIHEFPIIGIIPLPNGYVVFSYGNDSFNGLFFKIETIIDDKQITRLRTIYVTETTLNTISGVFKYNHNGDLIIYWWDGVNSTSTKPKFLNLDTLPFSVPLTSDYELGNDSINNGEIGLLNIFPDCQVPNMEVVSIYNTGGNVKIGGYNFMMSYLIDDYNSTNWFISSNSIPICIEQNKSIANNDGLGVHRGTTQSGFISKTLNFKFTGLDIKFKKFRVAYVYRENNSETISDSKIIGKFNVDAINGTTVSFIGQTEGSINSSELIIDPISFIRIKTGTVLNENLIVANTKEGNQINYQKYANNIKAKWIIRNDGTAPIEANYHDNSIDLYFGKTVLLEEVYGLNIHLVMKDGSLSKGFHIPGREPLTLTSGFVTEIGSLPFNNVPITSSTPIVGYFKNGGIYYIGFNPTIYPLLATFISDNRFRIKKNSCNITITSAINGTMGYDFYDFFYNTTTGLMVLIFSAPPDEAYLPIDPSTNCTVQLDVDGTINELTDTGDTILVGSKYFHIYDTSTKENNFTGKLGYWENKSDVYPDIDDYDTWTVGDGTGGHPSGIGYKLNSLLRTANVRHHRMPSLETLYHISEDVIKVVGITLTDINIPDDILSNIQGFTFSYYKHDMLNSIIMGFDVIKANEFWRDAPFRTDNNIRFNDITLMNGSKQISINYLKVTHKVNINSTGISSSIKEFHSDFGNNCFYTSGQPSYAPTNNSATTPTNLNREACLMIYMQSSPVSPALLTFVQSPLLNSDFWCGNLVSFKVDLFKLNDNNQLCLMSNIIYTDSVHYFYGYGSGSPTEVNPIFQFDSFISHYTYHARGRSGTVGDADWNSASWPFALTYYSYYDALFKADLGDSSIVTLLDINDYNYNEAFSSQNTIKSPTKFNYLDDYLQSFPYRLNKSLKQESESRIDNWRIFRPEDYHESIKNKGEIIDIIAFNKSLIIRYKYQWFIARIRETLQTGNSNAYLGIGDIFIDANGNQTLLDELTPSSEGYFGDISQYASIAFVDGYFGIDIQKGLMMLLTNNYKEITNNESKEWFKENFTVDKYNALIDNPLNQIGACATHDKIHDRIIISLHKRIPIYSSTVTNLIYDLQSNGSGVYTGIANTIVEINGVFLHITQSGSFVWNGTTRDYVYGTHTTTWDDESQHHPITIITNGIFNNTYFKDNYITISYNTKFGIWMFLHSLQPNYLFSSNNEAYSVKNIYGTSYTISKLNNSLVKINGTSYIDLVFNTPKDVTKVLNGVVWRTDVKDGNGINLYSKTITSVMVYNDTQCSGIIPVNVVANWYNKDSGRSLNGEWFFNKIRDYVIDNTSAILDDNNQPVNNNVNKFLKKWYDNSLFISNFIVLRLIYDNANTNDLYITDVKVNFSKSDR